MSPFLKVMQLFLMMTGTVLGMLLLLLVTPDLEDSMLTAVRRYQKRHRGEARTEAAWSASATQAALYAQPPVGLAGVQVDHSRKFFVPWPDSPECNRYHIHFARQKSLPMTALVSFPGSGNTWLRYLVETASGVFTGSVYIDRRIISKGFYGEAVPPDCGCTAVQKTHGFALEGQVPIALAQRTAELKLFRGRGILLLRNPYEALLSYRNFLYGGHTGFAPHNRFKGQEWERFASQLALVWRDLAATWVNYTHGEQAMVLHFEQLRKDPSLYLNRLLRFLGITVDQQRLTCVLNHIDGPFRRPQSSQQLLFSSRDPFSARLHRILNSVIHELDQLLAQRGWDRAPTHLYKFYTGNATA